MDPNTTGQPAPDAQSPTPAPPPAANPTDPGWAAPPAWATPPPGQPTGPTDPGWAAQPAWATQPSAPSGGAGGGVLARLGGSIVGRIVAIVVVLAVIAGGYVVYSTVFNPQHLGQVVYTTVDQTDTSGCDTTSLVTSVKQGTSVWALYMWSHRLTSDQAVVEQDFRDGVSIGTYNLPTDKTSDADCLWVEDDLSQEFTQPGTYEIKLTVGSEVVADGKLTVTP